jgi:hypothetical protein
MAIMDMPEIGPLFATLSRMLAPGGAFVFSVTHPCFHSPAIQRFAEIYEEQAGRHVIRSGVKVSSYLSMPGIPPVMVVRMKLMRERQPLAASDSHRPPTR